MTKAELKAEYTRWRTEFSAGRLWTNEYALHLDSMLSNYFGMPGADMLEEDLG